jgi:2-keto-4-pentenoate hydratase/2-oxohepta-3-ene-1,7-dioic acid hydratase in catechol pathway
MRISFATTDEGDRVVAAFDDGYRELASSIDDLNSVMGSALPATRDLRRVVPVGPLHAPVKPGKIVAIGLNYRDHVREVGAQTPSEPLLFSKFPSVISGDGDTVVVDRTVTRRVDWEVELAAVIGRQAKDVSVSQALRHVFGYLVANDLSARDLQFADGQWIRGKNLDGFCPLGGTLVTADEIADPQRLALGTDVNGHAVQSSSTAEMIFTVAEIVSFCSRHFTLDPGDLILTGTPWGCGEFMAPRRSLQDGDVVRVWVEDVGSVTSTVRYRG